MTVRELIAILQGAPPGAQVCIDLYDHLYQIDHTAIVPPDPDPDDRCTVYLFPQGKAIGVAQR